MQFPYGRQWYQNEIKITENADKLDDYAQLEASLALVIAQLLDIVGLLGTTSGGADYGDRDRSRKIKNACEHCASNCEILEPAQAVEYLDYDDEERELDEPYKWSVQCFQD